MGDISMRGKGRALKMQSGGSTTERRKKARENKIEKMFGPKTKRPGLTIKPLIPKPVKPMPRDPKKFLSLNQCLEIQKRFLSLNQCLDQDLYQETSEI
jgi:hypothetical protein